MFKRLSNIMTDDDEFVMVESGYSPQKTRASYVITTTPHTVIGDYFSPRSPEVIAQQSRFQALCTKQAQLLGTWNSLVITKYHVQTSATLLHTTTAPKMRELDQLLETKNRLLSIYNEKIGVLIEHLYLLKAWHDRTGVPLLPMTLDASFPKTDSEAQLSDEIEQINDLNESLSAHLKDLSCMDAYIIFFAYQLGYDPQFKAKTI